MLALWEQLAALSADESSQISWPMVTDIDPRGPLDVTANRTRAAGLWGLRFAARLFRHTQDFRADRVWEQTALGNRVTIRAEATLQRGPGETLTVICRADVDPRGVQAYGIASVVTLELTVTEEF